MQARAWSIAVLIALTVACGDDNVVAGDAALDASGHDARMQDGAMVDAAAIDASTADAQGLDATRPDANHDANAGFDAGAIAAQEEYFKASNTDAEDRFGFAVAIDSDTLVVGATQEDSSAIGVDGDQSDDSATDSGAVYVFVRSGGVWSQQAYLKASNTEAGDRFGGSVALSGDTLVVGANQEDSNATGVDGDPSDNGAADSGAVYVFVRSGGVWSQQAYLKASNTDAEDGFGGSVALVGDTLAVGALGEASPADGIDGDQADNSAEAAGAVYVFVRHSGVWSQQAYVKASNSSAYDVYGIDVALSGETLVVGAQTESSNATGVNGDQTNNLGTGSGAAYVYVRSGTVWSQQAYLKPSTIDFGMLFGTCVAIDGDTLAVGAYQEHSNATGINGDETNRDARSSGATYVFTRSGSTWRQVAYLKASNTSAEDLFGYDVALAGDRLVVGAPREDSNATGLDGDENNDSSVESGAAYLFVRSAGTWSQQSYLKASNTGTNDELGLGLAVSGDTIAIGARRESSNATGIGSNQADNSATFSGAVYVFR